MIYGGFGWRHSRLANPKRDAARDQLPQADHGGRDPGVHADDHLRVPGVREGTVDGTRDGSRTSSRVEGSESRGPGRRGLFDSATAALADRDRSRLLVRVDPPYVSASSASFAGGDPIFDERCSTRGSAGSARAARCCGSGSGCRRAGRGRRPLGPRAPRSGRRATCRDRSCRSVSQMAWWRATACGLWARASNSRSSARRARRGRQVPGEGEPRAPILRAARDQVPAELGEAIGRARRRRSAPRAASNTRYARSGATSISRSQASPASAAAPAGSCTSPRCK